MCYLYKKTGVTEERETEQGVTDMDRKRMRLLLLYSQTHVTEHKGSQSDGSIKLYRQNLISHVKFNLQVTGDD